MSESEEIYEGDPPPTVWDLYAAAALTGLLQRGYDIETAETTAVAIAYSMMARRDA